MTVSRRRSRLVPVGNLNQDFAADPGGPVLDDGYLHTNRELALMLAGRKPLAMFADSGERPVNQAIIPTRRFDRHVRAGRFSRYDFAFEQQVHPKTGQQLWLRFVLYCVKGEEWRFKAFQLAMQTQRVMRGGPFEAIDRMVGSLLGYSDAENDFYVAQGKATRRRTSGARTRGSRR